MDGACRNCRREGIKLFLKGEKCFTPKCPVSRRAYPPGLHGPKGVGKMTEYGTQLREKQKAKRIYGIRERQFKNYVDRALARTGNTAEHLLRSLEQRLDSVVWRAGFTASHRQARQLVGHGHFLVNGEKANVPSMLVAAGDRITLHDASELDNVQNVIAATLVAKQQYKAPAWLVVNPDERSITVLRSPEATEIEQSFNSKLIIEFYSR